MKWVKWMDKKFSDVLNDFEPKEVSELLIGYDENGKLHSHSFLNDKSLLVVDSIGSNKDKVLKQMLVSGMFNWKPNDLQFVLCDCENVGFSEYSETPYNMYNYVLTEIKEVNSTLQELMKIEEKRFKMFSEIKVRNINTYNEYARNNDIETIPFILVVINELEPLMLSEPEIERRLIHLLIAAKAAGITFLIGSRKTKPQVLNGNILNSVPSRICMQVDSSIDRRRVLGDLVVKSELLESDRSMIYRSSRNELIRLHSANDLEGNAEAILKYVNKKYGKVK